MNALYSAALKRDYVTLLRRGERAPTITLALLRGVSPERMRSHVNLARVNGFLTRSKKGRGQAGGELTEKARLSLTGV